MKLSNINIFNPLVSIIIPVYNGANYLRCAIDSAINQDYQNIEIIVVNDGSTDDTEEICKNYGDKIIYFFKENGGVASALNMAIRNSNGEYISWLSHDDYYLPEKISRQIYFLQKIKNNHQILLFSDVNCHYIQNDNIIEIVKIEIDIPHFGLFSKIESLKFLFSTSLHGCSLLIPKTLFQQTGYFNENLATTQDYDLWFKFIKAGYLFYYLPEVLLVSRQHELQDSRKKRNISKKEEAKLFNNAYKTFINDINSSEEDKIFFKKKLKMVNRYMFEFFFNFFLNLKKLIN